MKKTLLIAALTMMSASAFASKARLIGLGGMARTTASDVQSIFEQPHKMWEVGDLATIEFGPTGTTYSNVGASTEIARGANNAEGGFLRSHNNTKWGAYIGHQSDSLLYMLNGATVGKAVTAGEGLSRLENPINLWYGIKAGDLEWGFNLFYANSEVKSGADMNKKNAMGVSAGVRADRWNADLVLGLGAKVEDTSAGSDEEFKATSSVRLQGEYAVNDDLLTYAQITNFGGKHTTSANVEDMDLDHMNIQLGVESKIKSDVVHFFYGAMLQSATEKNKTTGSNPEKVEQTLLPLYFGFEADAASWLVLRASLKQNFLLNSVKVSTTTSSDANDIDSTVASLGAGFKFGKLMVDGVLSAGTSGNLNFNNGTKQGTPAAGDIDSGNFMSTVSATYMF